MFEFNLRDFRAKLPPWVVLLVGLFALNAISPAHASQKKVESPGEAGLSQKVEQSQTPGRTGEAVDYLDPGTLVVTDLHRVSTRIPKTRMPDRQVPPSTPEGMLRGRAPPAGDEA